MCKLAGIHILKRPYRVNISSIVQNRARAIPTGIQRKRSSDWQKDERKAAKNKKGRRSQINQRKKERFNLPNQERKQLRVSFFRFYSACSRHYTHTHITHNTKWYEMCARCQHTCAIDAYTHINEQIFERE